MTLKTSSPRTTRSAERGAGRLPPARGFVDRPAGSAIPGHEFSKISRLPPGELPATRPAPVQLMRRGGDRSEDSSDEELGHHPFEPQAPQEQEHVGLLGHDINPFEVEAAQPPPPTLRQRAGRALRSAWYGAGRLVASAGRSLGGKLGLSYSERPQQIHDDFGRFDTAEWQGQATQDKLKDLYRMQERVNRHVRESEKQNLALTPEMAVRMDELRGHFETQIGNLRAENGDLALPETWSSRLSRAPLIGRAFNDRNRQVRDLWRGLQAPDSTIRVDAGALAGDGAQAAFENRTMTQLARMMPSQTARRMLRKMQSRDQAVTIRPSLDMDNAGARPEAEGNAGIERRADQRSEMAKSRKPRPRFRHPEDLHHYSNPGGGSNVEVNMPAVLGDNQLRGFSKKDREFPLTSYSVLAHELIHGKHIQEGTLRNDVPMERIKQSRRGTPESAADWDNYEEYHTIQGGKTSSNKVDAELGLPARWDHRGTFEAEHGAVVANAGAFGYQEI